MIPFSRTIENFLAALPTQAALEVRIRELAAENDILASENAKLKAQVIELQPKPGMDINAVNVLRALFQADEGENNQMSEDQLAAVTGMKKSVVLYHLDKLQGSGFVQVSLDFDDGGYYIMPPGRAFIIENGMS